MICSTQTAYNSSKIFPAHFARRLFVPPLLNLFAAFVSSVIASDWHWYFAWTS